MTVKINAPFKNGGLDSLHAGDRVLLSGTIYTARDAAHEILFAMLRDGEKLPFDIDGSVIYYCGPCPAKPGEIIGSAGPTTAGRMDAYTPLLLDSGMKAMIGKGPRNDAVTAAIKKNGAVYFGAVGGTGALIAGCVRACDTVAFPELGCEAVRRLTVEDMPLTVLTDTAGNDLYRLRAKQ